MKRLLALALLVLSVLSADAATITGTLVDNSGTAVSRGRIRFLPSNNPGSVSGSTVTGIQKTVTTETDGTFEVVLLTGNYSVTANGWSFTISVPAGSDSYEITTIASGLYTFPWAGIVRATSADTNAAALDEKLVAGDNITIEEVEEDGVIKLRITGEAGGGAGTNSTIYVNGTDVDGANFTNSASIIWSDNGTNVSAVVTNVLGNQITDGTVTADDLGANSVSASELDESGVRDGLEAVLRLPQLQSAVTDAQVPNDITIDLATVATTANGVAANSIDGTDIALSGQAAGSIMYYNGTDWAVLTIGSPGQVLEVNAGGTGLEYDTDDSSAGSSTAFNDLADTSGNGSVTLAHTNIWDFNLDGSRALQILASDTDKAADTTILTLADNDSGDANSIFLDVIDDADSAATSIFKISATALTTSLAATFSGTVTVPDNSFALGTKTTGNYAAGDAEAGAALTGDTATGFFSIGTIEAARLPNLDAMNGAVTDSQVPDTITASNYQPLDSDLTAIGALADPNADRLLFWDDSLGAYTHLTAGSGLNISGTTITATGSATAWTDIADATAGGVIAFAGFTNQLTSTLDGGTVLSIYNQDADNASDTVLIDLAFDDNADANSIFLRMRYGIDDTPGTAFTFAADGFTSTAPINVGTGNGQIDVGSTGVRVTSDGDGAITFLGLSAGNDEDWTFNLDDTANTVVMSSSTGVSLFDYLTGAFTISVNTLELGHASANTLTAASGNLSIEGNQVYRASGTDVAVADGGTGLSSGTSGGILGFTASGTLASSAALAANAIVIGGGAGATPTTTTTGSGVLTALGNTANASGGIVTVNGTATLTEKTLDASSSGNVLKQTKQLILQRPDYGDGVGAVPQTNTYTASGLMHYTFSGNAETNANWVVYEFDCPSDLDTSVAVTLRLGFLSGGTDSDDYVFHFTYAQVAAGTAYPTGTSISTSPIVMTITPTTAANGDLQYSSATTATGWAASLTPGRAMAIRCARLQNSQDDSARDVQLVFTYGSTL